MSIDPIQGLFVDPHTFAYANQQQLIRNCKQGFFAWLSHIFGQNIYVVIETNGLQSRVYVPISQAREIARTDQHIGRAFAKVLHDREDAQTKQMLKTTPRTEYNVNSPSLGPLFREEVEDDHDGQQLHKKDPAAPQVQLATQETSTTLTLPSLEKNTTFTTTGFQAVFSPNSPATKILVPFISLADAMHLRHTCKGMLTAVGCSLTVKMVTRLGFLLLNANPKIKFSLENAPENCKKNRCFVELAIRRKGANLLSADERFLKDPLLLKIALVAANGIDPEGFVKLKTLINDSNWHDVEPLVESAIPLEKREAWIRKGFFAFLHNPYNNDTDIGLALVEKNGVALRYLSPLLRSNKIVVSAAIRHWAGAFEYANPTLQEDRTIFRETLHQWMGATLQISPADREKAAMKTYMRWGPAFINAYRMKTEDIGLNVKECSLHCLPTKNWESFLEGQITDSNPYGLL